MKLIPATACLAVGPDGKVNIDFIRRNRAGAEYAAATIEGIPWPLLAQKGWRILNVTVMPTADVTGDEPLELVTAIPQAPEKDLTEPRDRPRKGPDVSRKPKQRHHRSGGGSSVMRFGK